MCVYVLHCASEDVDKCTSGFIRHTVNITIMRSLDRLCDEAINILFSVVQVHSMNHAFDKSLYWLMRLLNYYATTARTFCCKLWSNCCQFLNVSYNIYIFQKNKIARSSDVLWNILKEHNILNLIILPIKSYFWLGFYIDLDTWWSHISNNINAMVFSCVDTRAFYNIWTNTCIYYKSN